MRILIAGRGYSDRDKEQMGIFEWDQARALAAAGHDVRFAAVDTRSVRHGRPLGFRQFDHEGMTVYYESLPGVPGSLQRRVQSLASVRLWQGVRRSGWTPDVVHAHFGASVLEPAKRRGIPCVYTEHLSMVNRESLSPGELSWLRHTYSLPDRLICVSRPLADSVREHTGVPARVVCNVVDTETFSRRETVPSAGPFRFAAAGNLIERKGYDLLLDALAEVRARGFDAVLAVAGGGEEESALREQAVRLGLEDRVEFLGRRPRTEIAELYCRSDAFVLASRRETFGVVYIEAMAAGLPVIATVCGGPEDFVREDNGILIPPEDVRALADAMERMIRTRDRYDSDAIARFARDSFSPGAVAAELERIYREICPKV
ncbi:MAG: glycosyltransferase [Oscillospiraceae bacterium]|nr:glycosyltransferase [Oscillospiraceae bacterium]